MIRIIFGRQKEQLLAGAKSEILRNVFRTDLAGNNIRALNRQIESQALDIGHTLEGYAHSRREQDLLHEELADRERALRDTRIRTIRELRISIVGTLNNTYSNGTLSTIRSSLLATTGAPLPLCGC